MADTKGKRSESKMANDNEFPHVIRQMNGSTCADIDASAESNVDPDEEEMKTFFPEPFPRKSKTTTKRISPKRRTSSSASSNRDGETSVSVEEAAKVEEKFKGTENNLMTRRITIAGGFLDIALFTANCEQLKFLLELGELHIYYRHVLGLIITSLVLQLLVGLTMCLLSCQVIKKESDEHYADYLNHATMGLVAMITIVNIFISTFGPKGTIVTRLFRAFVYPNTDNPLWMAYLNATRNYVTEF